VVLASLRGEPGQEPRHRSLLPERGRRVEKKNKNNGLGNDTTFQFSISQGKINILINVVFSPKDWSWSACSNRKFDFVSILIFFNLVFLLYLFIVAVTAL